MLERFFGRKDNKRHEETKIDPIQREFVYKIDHTMHVFIQKDDKVLNLRMHFNRIDFGHKSVGFSSEYFFEETVLKDDNGIPVGPYVDIYETQKGTLKHSRKKLVGDKLVLLPDADKTEVEKISKKLDNLIEVFGHKNK